MPMFPMYQRTYFKLILMKTHFIVRNPESEYKVVENNIEELSELEIMVINKLRTISSEDRADVAKYLNRKTDV